MPKTAFPITFASRGAYCTHPLAKQLFALMDRKQTNLAVAADVTKTDELIDLAHQLGPSLAVFKTHIDMIEDFTPETTKKLRQLADQHQFLLFEDRKFADIGHTALHQYEGGIYKISSWAHLVNAHPLPGPGLIEGLQQVGQKRGNGLLLLAELSSKENLIDLNYTNKTVELALRYPHFVLGFIAQRQLTEHPAYIHMTPGVQMESAGDSLGQQYLTPHHVIFEKRSDLIIVGRGIIAHPTPAKSAQEYRQAAWDAYLQKID